jgi:hypothetical protein
MWRGDGAPVSCGGGDLLRGDQGGVKHGQRQKIWREIERGRGGHQCSPLSRGGGGGGGGIFLRWLSDMKNWRGTSVYIGVGREGLEEGEQSLAQAAPSGDGT